MAGAVSSQQSLPPLRDDLDLHKGPRTNDGSPTYTIHDPVLHKFYRIGWVEFEILSRWHLKTPQKIIEALATQTTIEADIDAVEEVAVFLYKNDLLAGYSDHSEEKFMQIKGQQKGGVKSLLRQYMFLRVPLFNPTGLLQKIEPYTGFLYTRGFVVTICLLGLLALYLVSREWSAFVSSFMYLFTFSGIVLYGFMIMFVKAVHELGHALTAHRYGCRVPVIGMALLVFFPVMYTDTTDAWKLEDKKQRLMISSAGVISELVLAVIAALLWVVLPEGGLKTVAFLMASTSWVMTLFINLNPFMKFDGYYILADWLEIENMQDRAKEAANRHFKNMFLKQDEPVSAPEKARFLIAFGYGIWAYRMLIFLTISLLIYHLFFKALALCMIALNFYVTILMPIIKNLSSWVGDCREGSAAAYRGRIGALALLIIGLFFLPWHSHVTLPAAIYPAQYTTLYDEYQGYVEEVLVKKEQKVQKGDVLMRLSSPDLIFETENLIRRYEVLKWQYDIRGMDLQVKERSLIIKSEIDSVEEALKALQDKRQTLIITAPHDGLVSFDESVLKAGTWIGKSEPLISVYDFAKQEVRGFVPEPHFARLETHGKAYFYPVSAPHISMDLEVRSLESASVHDIKDPLFLSVFEGGVAVRQDQKERYIPDQASFPIYFNVANPGSVAIDHSHIERGVVVIEGQARSLFIRMVTKIWSIFVRESSF